MEKYLPTKRYRVLRERYVKNSVDVEIKELTESSVIDINPLALNHIKLSINGQCIGTGKIIDAGDSLAIEIQEISRKK